jgi:hypothetical protein
MKRAFIMTDDCHLASAMVAISTRDVLSIGDRITTTRLLDLGYAAQIAEGEGGTVDHIDASTGLVEILMDLPHRGLHAWHNHMWLEPFGTEDILDGIICVSRIISEFQRVA